VSGDEVDQAIDNAVREIMGAEPPAGLRHRVLRRLSEPERRPLPGARRLALVGGLALSVAMAGFVVVKMNRERTAAPIQVVSAPTSPPIDTATGAPEPAPGSGPQSVRPTIVAKTRPPGTPAVERRPRGRDQRLVAATSLADGDERVVVTPLDDLRRIEPAPLPSEVVRIEAIALAPLQMEPVGMEPLSSTPR
jgi:hypothetical protein